MTDDLKSTFDAFIGFYPVCDLEATRDFYERDLGLALARDQGTCLIFRTGAETYLGFCQHAEALSPHHGLILTLVTREVDAVYQHLRSLGIETEAPPTLNPTYGIYHFFARDPDGYRIEVQRFLEPL
ncbi:MAG: VOC family protein [Trueperaceae bacterium]|nr:MAG: VOC family protein [Trueperaceae bacterium]